MNAFEKQRQRIMRKLRQRQLQEVRVFQSSTSQMQQQQDPQNGQIYYNEYNNHENSTNYIPGEERQREYQMSENDDGEGDNNSYYYEKSDDKDKNEQLRERLIMIIQKESFERVFEVIKEKIFWTKFLAFKRISKGLQKDSLSNHEKTTKMRRNWMNTLIYSSNGGTQQAQEQIKKLVFWQLKERKDRSINQAYIKSEFFIKYFINHSYSKLSESFSLIKQYVEGQKVTFKIENSTKQMKVKENEQKLRRIDIQSKRLKVKCAFCVVKNFVNKCIFKRAFDAIHLFQRMKSLQTTINQQSLTPSKPQANKFNNGSLKDGRFIKKKAVPHKIIQENSSKRSIINYSQNNGHYNHAFNNSNSNTYNLNHIYLSNHQVKSIKKDQLQFIRKVNKVINHKMWQYQNRFIRNIECQYGVNLKDGNKEDDKYDVSVKFFQPQRNGVEDHTSPDMETFQNVMKTMCYLSSRTHEKRRVQKYKSIKMTSLYILGYSLMKIYYDKISGGFYSIKCVNLIQSIEIVKQIRVLQEQKQHYLKLFETNNSVLDVSSYSSS